MIARKTWREVRSMGLVYLVILLIMNLAAILAWPDTREAFKNPSIAKFLMNMIPIGSLRRGFEAMSGPENSAFAAYLAIQHFFKDGNVVGIACAVLIGTGSLARERESGTLEFLLARPVSRSAILWSKYWVLALVILVPILINALAILPIASLIDREVEVGRVLLAAFHSSLFILFFLSMTVWMSSLFRTQVHVAFAIGGFIVVTASIYFIKHLRGGSLFMLADYDTFGPILAGNGNLHRLFFGTGLWLLLGSIGFYALTDRNLRRMDV